MPGLPFEKLSAAVQMLNEQYTMGQRQITQQFDEGRYWLDQQELEPEQYNKAYKRLMQQAQQEGIRLYQTAQAQALFIRQLHELAEDGSLQPYQVNKIAYRMAGVEDPQMLHQLSGEPEKIDWRKAYRENIGIQRDLAKFLKNYQVKDGKLYKLDKPMGEIVDEKHPEGPEVVRHYNMTRNLLDYYTDQQRAIYTQLTPMEQGALEMERVAVDKTDEKLSPFRRAFEIYKRTIFSPGLPFRPAKLGEIKQLAMKGVMPEHEETLREFLFGPKIPEPKTQEEYDALPIGTKYIDLDGIEKTKE